MKIPFENTISSAYRFAFSNILSIIGIAWFPYLILSAAVGALLYRMWPVFIAFMNAADAAKAAGKRPDPAEIQAFMVSFFGSYALVVPLVLLMTAMVVVGMMRKALGLHPRPVFIFFSLGGQVWRLIGAYCLLFIMAYGGAILAVLLVAIAAALLNGVSQQASIITAVVLGIVAALAYIYSFVRLYFFLPAVVVAENRIGLGRSWQLGGGNFWRIVGTVLLVTLPLALVTSVVLPSILQIFVVTDLGSLPSHPESAQKTLEDMLRMVGKVLPIFVALQLIQSILTTALNVGAAAAAYRSVTGYGESGAPEVAA
ncbi:MAG: hypothetical protein WDM91_21620 [Rhizomicrobium sp.]